MSPSYDEGRPSTDHSERAVYVISVAADLAGVHPQTLRIYERKGLLSPKRTAGNTRRYSERDVERLRQIQRLTQEGVNLAGVRIIMDMQRRLDEMQRSIEIHLQTLAESTEERAPGTRPARPHWGVLARLDDVRNIYELRTGPHAGPLTGPQIGQRSTPRAGQGG